jgi:hypothetical protein
LRLWKKILKMEMKEICKIDTRAGLLQCNGGGNCKICICIMEDIPQ